MHTRKRGAHPRACGENGRSRPWAGRSRGSSPRVRGKPHRLGANARARGLIPARAGKTISCGSSGASAAAHPRACGENGVEGDLEHDHEGSSPRVRGKRAGSAGYANAFRLIPARAGKTARAACGTPASRAHPRACGENAQVYNDILPGGGSSPRVRGKRLRDRMVHRARRLIPARAGKTMMSLSPTTWGCGSSPRVRGKRGGGPGRISSPGLIPARAGKTRRWRPRPWAGPAHPRACGENRRGAPELRGAEGSSPRVRGKLSGEPIEGFPHRLIPARAGKTGRSWRSSLEQTAHPRACGENL